MKRKDRTNGNRQYFQAVRHLRRAQLRDWKAKHDPEKLAKEVKQQAVFSMNRQKKQEARDNAR